MAENHSDHGVVAIVRMFLEFVKELLGGFANRLNTLEINMAKIDEAQAKQAEAIAATDAAVARVVEDNTAQNVEIQRLKDLIAAGETVTAEQLDGLIAGNQRIIDVMNALDPIPNSPAGPAV